MKLKGPGKVLLIALLVAGGFFVAKYFLNAPKVVGESKILGKVSIPDAPEASLSGNTAVKLALPSTTAALNGGLQGKIYEMAWQAATNVNYANGGERTTKGSLLDKAGWDLQIVRQDNCTQSNTDLVKWAKDYHDGKTKDGQFAIYMGSGIPAFLHGMNDVLKDFPDVQIEGFAAVGKSFGEDKVIGDESFKKNPQLLRGKVIRGVKMDGDLDLALKFCGDNGIRVNQNEKLYDADALNFSYVGGDGSFLTAVNDYNNANYKETRKIVIAGKTTSQDTAVGIDLVATWTPGDVNARNGRGGVSIISTKEYASIMPAIIISSKKFLNDNRDKIEAFIVAVAEAGDQIRSFEDVKKYACGLNAKIWNEQDQNYWYKYYNGEGGLGGSMVYNLADMSRTFGLKGTSDIYKEVYNTFGTLQSSLYTEDLPSYIEYPKAFDKSFMMSIVANHPELLEGKALEVQYASNITQTVASKNVQINFETGSATISSSSYETLDQIYTSAQAAEGLKVGIYGHTDNTGSADKNQVLSEQRAESVKQYLLKKGLDAARLESKGYGDTQPIGDNHTAAGKAKNRRVQIVLGQ
jgi:outer membrane protein OmpA-like peptidoglycan-associated protein